MYRTSIECCYKCTKREAGCHCTCETYKTERAELNESKPIREKARVINDYFRDKATLKAKLHAKTMQRLRTYSTKTKKG